MLKNDCILKGLSHKIFGLGGRGVVFFWATFNYCSDV